MDVRFERLWDWEKSWKMSKGLSSIWEIIKLNVPCQEFLDGIKTLIYLCLL